MRFYGARARIGDAAQEIAGSVKLGILPKPIDIREHVDTSLIGEAQERTHG